MRWLASLVVVSALIVVPVQVTTWDPQLCRNPAFAAQHKDLCGNPLLNGGGPSGECGGLCGVIRDVIGHIPGLGGLL